MSDGDGGRLLLSIVFGSRGFSCYPAPRQGQGSNPISGTTQNTRKRIGFTAAPTGLFNSKMFRTFTVPNTVLDVRLRSFRTRD